MKVVVFDLDDTLYSEIDYLMSAFREISDRIFVNLGYTEIYEKMMLAYAEKRNVFEYLNEYYGISIPISTYLEIYRNHIPRIQLDVETIETLSVLKKSGVALGLITDGRTNTQLNKIQALNLNRFIDKENMIISEEFGSEKPSEKNFRYFNNKIQNGEFYYVGDNVKKDFIGPNKLKWTSICLMDKGKNIHKQIFEVESDFLPKFRISNISEIIGIVVSK